MYFTYFLYSPKDDKLTVRFTSDTGVVMPRIKQMELSTLVTTISPLAEQRQSSSKFRLLMELCYELEKQVMESIKESELLMKGVLREVLERKEAENV